MRFSQCIRGHTDTDSVSWKAGMVRLSESRKGVGNPRFGMRPWNYDLTKETSASLMSVSKKHMGKIVSEDTRQKQSDRAKLRLIHGHTGKKHSAETIAFLRHNTLEMIRSGVFSQFVSKPHVAFALLLDEMGVEYVEERRVGFFSFDFYLTDYDVYVEVDGDYFHSNPSVYPEGPVTKTQKINYYRDMKKNEFCKERGIRLMRFWECQIMKDRNTVKDILEREVTCKQKK
jgi:G:T-mismatch repair DNA endonuclease (very short patch repair protein)